MCETWNGSPGPEQDHPARDHGTLLFFLDIEAAMSDLLQVCSGPTGIAVVMGLEQFHSLGNLPTWAAACGMVMSACSVLDTHD